MDFNEFDTLVCDLDGVRRREVEGLVQWRLHDRLIARQLDADSVVIRSEFATRDALLAEYPDSFSVPTRFAKHMMIVADLASADPAALEDAVVAAWHLQSSGS